LDEIDALVKEHGLGILAGADLIDYRRMETFVSKTPDMLRLVQDIPKPRKFEDFVEYGLGDPPQNPLRRARVPRAKTAAGRRRSCPPYEPLPQQRLDLRP
jgi:hypothetical protein